MTQTRGADYDEDPAPRRRRRLRTFLLGALVLVVLAAGTVIYFQVTKTPAPTADPAPPTPPAETSTTVPSTAPVTTFVQTAQADGCLGGPDPHTAVLAAQQSATLDSIGAAEFALAVMRFAGTFPFADDVDTVLNQVMVDPAAWREAFAKINAQERDTGNEYRLIAPETWKHKVLNNTSDAAIVQVYVTREMVAAATQPLSSQVVVEYHLVAQSGHWMVAENGTPSDAGDPTFTAGFTSYFGGCA